MFERFTDRARRVVVLAQEEARMLSHNYIGTEHILLGLLHESEGIASGVLTELGVTLEAARTSVEEMVGRGSAEPSGHIPFTPRAKKVLELSLREALTLGHDYIGTEHILLGLTREGEGVGCQVITALGADIDRVRQVTIHRAAQPENVEGRTGRFSLQVGPGTLTAIEDRLARIERRLGIAASASVGELSRRLGKVRRDKAEAIEAQDFDRASQLRDDEKRLVDERTAALHEQSDIEPVMPVMEELAVANAEVNRLRALLHTHGIDPGESVTPPPAPADPAVPPTTADPAATAEGDKPGEPPAVAQA